MKTSMKTSMKTYKFGNKSHPAAFTVQADSIREAIIVAADLLRAGIKAKDIYSEDYAQVTFVKNKAAMLIVQRAVS